MSKKVYKLSEIAELLDLSLDGDGEKRIASINNLKNAKSSELSFYYSKKFKKDLENTKAGAIILSKDCLLYTSPSPRDLSTSRMPSSA